MGPSGSSDPPMLIHSTNIKGYVNETTPSNQNPQKMSFEKYIEDNQHP